MSTLIKIFVKIMNTFFSDDGWVPAVVPVRGEAQKYLISIGRTLNVMEWDGMSERAATLKTVHTVDQDAPTINWLNDGKCDSSGRFWTGNNLYYSNKIHNSLS